MSKEGTTITIMNTMTKYIIGAVLVAALFFYAGVKYTESKAPVSAAGRTTASTSAGFAGRTGRGATAGSSFTTGTIVKVESGDIVITPSGATGSEVVLVGTSTPVMQTVAGSLSDLAAGQTVMVSGTSNSDGSLSATSIQLRPQ